MSLGQYGTETVRNLPGSLESLGQGLWDAAQDPVGTDEGNRRRPFSARRNSAKDYLGVPTQ